jgi:beta-lactamase class A
MNYYSSYSSRNYRQPKRRRPIKRIVFTALVITFVIISGVIFLRKDTAEAPKTVDQTPQAAKVEDKPPQLPDLQPFVDNWVANNPGTYSIAIMNVDGTLIAQNEPNMVMDPASLYKLFVAYYGYQKVADGTYQANEPYAKGWTRLQCLDEMIRSSDSTCGEIMMEELGRQAVSEQMQTDGFKDSSLAQLQVSAYESALLLSRVYKGQGLTKEHKDAFLESLKTQNQDARYTRGLPSGIQQATIYNKVGWRDTIVWHDTSIIEFSNGKTIIVAVLTKNAGGFSNIARFGSELEKVLQ